MRQRGASYPGPNAKASDSLPRLKQAKQRTSTPRSEIHIYSDTIQHCVTMVHNITTIIYSTAISDINTILYYMSYYIQKYQGINSWTVNVNGLYVFVKSL